MKNFYCYSFYLLSMFTQKVFRKKNDYAFTGMVYLSLLMSFNIFTILGFLELTGQIKLRGQASYIVVMLVILGINYFFLVANGKSVSIIEYYKTTKQSKINSIAFYVYVLVSIVLICYSSYLVRKKGM
jgi:hypothetical protein